MAKYQVLRRVDHTAVNYRTGQVEAGKMVEFVQIPEDGLSQVQVYFVPNSIPEAEILGEASRHHEVETKARGGGFEGPQSPLNGAEAVAEPIMQVEVKSGKITVKEVAE